jgi:hypothetical protein
MAAITGAMHPSAINVCFGKPARSGTSPSARPRDGSRFGEFAGARAQGCLSLQHENVALTAT